LWRNFKYLSTSNIHNVEAKGRDRFESLFFGKFLICSNREDSFIEIDKEETRFWVRKIPKIEQRDYNFEDKLFSEIPAFLFFLLNREYFTEKKTRMWFSPKDLETEALLKVKSRSNQTEDKELLYALLDVLDYFDKDEIQFTVKELLNVCKFFKLNLPPNRLRSILKKDWGLTPVANTLSYVSFTIISNFSYAETNSKGRYFTLNRKKINSLLMK